MPPSIFVAFALSTKSFALPPKTVRIGRRIASLVCIFTASARRRRGQTLVMEVAGRRVTMLTILLIAEIGLFLLVVGYTLAISRL